jgi:hypothetical protein
LLLAETGLSLPLAKRLREWASDGASYRACHSSGALRDFGHEVIGLVYAELSPVQRHAKTFEALNAIIESDAALSEGLENCLEYGVVTGDLTDFLLDNNEDHALITEYNARVQQVQSAPLVTRTPGRSHTHFPGVFYHL